MYPNHRIQQRLSSARRKVFFFKQVRRVNQNTNQTHSCDRSGTFQISGAAGNRKERKKTKQNKTEGARCVYGCDALRPAFQRSGCHSSSPPVCADSWRQTEEDSCFRSERGHRAVTAVNWKKKQQTNKKKATCSIHEEGR